MKNRRIVDKKIKIDKRRINDFFVDRAKKYNPKFPEVSMLYGDKNPEFAKAMDKEEKEVLLSAIQPAKSDKVLDIGCGIGRWAKVLSGKVSIYHGTDMTAELIDIAKKRSKGISNASFQVLSAEEIRPELLKVRGDKVFDKIVVAGVLHYVNDDSLKKILRNIGACSSSNTRIIIRGPIAKERRLTLNGVWSEEMGCEYSSIYRTKDEMRAFLKESLPTFDIVVDRPLFEPKSALNNRSETQQHLFVLAQKKLQKTAYCFDLDGTITKKEILPLLSYEIGLHEEMMALTEATIKGVIPFHRSFLLRCRLLSDIPISRVQKIIKGIELNESIVRFIRKNKDNCFIITGNLDVWVAPLLDKIGCKSYCSEANYKGDKLLNVSKVLEKADAIEDLRKDFDRIISVGDGMGDVRMFEGSDVSIAFGGVHQPVETLIKLSDYLTYNEKSLCRLLNTL